MPKEYSGGGGAQAAEAAEEEEEVDDDSIILRLSFLETGDEKERDRDSENRR